MVQIKTGDFPLVVVFNLPLEKSAPAANFGDSVCLADQTAGQPAQHVKPPPDPEVIEVGDLEPRVRHLHFCGSREELNSRFSGAHEWKGFPPARAPSPRAVCRPSREGRHPR